MKNSTKKIVIPLYGSKTALGSLNYLDTLYGPIDNLEVMLVHISPALPSVLIDDTTKTKVKVIEGSESAVNDILKETRNDDSGMIILGRRGVSAIREFFMEYSVGKILHSPAGPAIWIV
jgi:hypothetical protein